MAVTEVQAHLVNGNSKKPARSVVGQTGFNTLSFPPGPHQKTISQNLLTGQTVREIVLNGRKKKVVCQSVGNIEFGFGGAQGSTLGPNHSFCFSLYSVRR